MMFRLTLTDADAVLTCMPVSQALVVVRGSVVTSCEECDTPVWRAPGLPLVAVDEKTGRLRPRSLADPIPNVVLCLSCSAAHQAAGS